MVLESAVLVALVIGLTEIVKKMGLVRKFLPLAALILGVGLSYLAKVGEIEVINGLVAGLTAMGLWSGAKASLGK